MKRLNNLTKKQKIIIISVITIIFITIIGFTYAFFITQIGNGINTQGDLTSDKSTKLIFESGNPIGLNANIDNLAEGENNLSSNTISKAILSPGTDDVNITDLYNVSFIIPKNTFIYTVDENTPEVILTIHDNNGEEINNIEGLNYVTVNDSITNESVSGFDITTKKGVFNIKEDIQIIASYPNETVHEWNVKITFVNLDTDQYLNEGNGIKVDLILHKGPILAADYLMSIDEGKGILIKHTSSIETSAGDNNYRYSGGNDVVNNYVCFGSDEIVCPVDDLYRIMGIYSIDNIYSLKIIKAYPIDKNKDAIYSTNDRMTFGFDVKWEGSDTSISSDDASLNLYFNEEYYSELELDYQNMIKSNYVNIGYINSDNTPKNLYNLENNTKTNNKYNISLMSASDYMYGASQEYWNLLNYEGNSETFDDEYYNNEIVKNNNWLHMINESSYNRHEFTISPTPGNMLLYISDNNGTVRAHSVSAVSPSTGSTSTTYFYKADSPLYVRPVMYLKESVYIESGSGTETDPYRLTM